MESLGINNIERVPASLGSLLIYISQPNFVQVRLVWITPLRIHPSHLDMFNSYICELSFFWEMCQTLPMMPGKGLVKTWTPPLARQGRATAGKPALYPVV